MPGLTWSKCLREVGCSEVRIALRRVGTFAFSNLTPSLLAHTDPLRAIVLSLTYLATVSISCSDLRSVAFGSFSSARPERDQDS
jgi:hypothetical protein